MYILIDLVEGRKDEKIEKIVLDGHEGKGIVKERGIHKESVINIFI